MAGINRNVYLSSTSWTCPAGITKVIAYGMAGGGGGDSNGGDGGGGGANMVPKLVDVVPNTTYTITIGNGGSSGSNGGDTTFGSTNWFGGRGGNSSGAESRGAITQGIYIFREGGGYGADEDGSPGYNMNNYVGGTSGAEAGGGGAGGRGNGANGNPAGTGDSAAANTGAGGGGSSSGSGGLGGSGYLELIWFE